MRNFFVKFFIFCVDREPVHAMGKKSKRRAGRSRSANKDGSAVSSSDRSLSPPIKGPSLPPLSAAAATQAAQADVVAADVTGLAKAGAPDGDGEDSARLAAVATPPDLEAAPAAASSLAEGEEEGTGAARVTTQAACADADAVPAASHAGAASHAAADAAVLTHAAPPDAGAGVAAAVPTRALVVRTFDAAAAAAALEEVSNPPTTPYYDASSDSSATGPPLLPFLQSHSSRGADVAADVAVDVAADADAAATAAAAPQAAAPPARALSVASSEATDALSSLPPARRLFVGAASSSSSSPPQQTHGALAFASPRPALSPAQAVSLLSPLVALADAARTAPAADAYRLAAAALAAADGTLPPDSLVTTDVLFALLARAALFVDSPSEIGMTPTQLADVVGASWARLSSRLRAAASAGGGGSDDATDGAPPHIDASGDFGGRPPPLFVPRPEEEGWVVAGARALSSLLLRTLVSPRVLPLSSASLCSGSVPSSSLTRRVSRRPRGS